MNATTEKHVRDIRIGDRVLVAYGVITVRGVEYTPSSDIKATITTDKGIRIGRPIPYFDVCPSE